MPRYKKSDYPVWNIRRFLEPGPIVLISSAWKQRTNVMTLGWHTVLEFTPSMVGCVISGANHSFRMIRQSGECVINLPTADIASTVVRIGNCSGRNVDKFEAFNLTPVSAVHVGAPLIDECYANFECRLADDTMVRRYNLFIFEVVKAHVAVSPRHPKTMHYQGDGRFMIAGRTVSTYRRLFRPGMLDRP